MDKPWNSSEILNYVEIASSTKDSLRIRWELDKHLYPLVDGFTIRYQAIGSTVVQYTKRLDRLATTYDITHLHENTYYDICIWVFANQGIGSDMLPTRLGTEITENDGDVYPVCLVGTTAINALKVALGSTLGAFIAIGIVVFFVLLAKWQHERQMKKQMLRLTNSQMSLRYSDVLDIDRQMELRSCRAGPDGGGPDDTNRSDLSSQSSNLSLDFNYSYLSVSPGDVLQYDNQEIGYLIPIMLCDGDSLTDEAASDPRNQEIEIVPISAGDFFLYDSTRQQPRASSIGEYDCKTGTHETHCAKTCTHGAQCARAVAWSYPVLDKNGNANEAFERRFEEREPAVRCTEPGQEMALSTGASSPGDEGKLKQNLSSLW